MLAVKNLHVALDGKPILQGINLSIDERQICVLQGPNGSGKSTLALTLMGHPRYAVTQGDMLLEGVSLLNLAAEERARRGLFLSFQQPIEISGVSVGQVLKSERFALGNEVPLNTLVSKVKTLLNEAGLPEAFFERPFNEGFSGGEKKRLELVQLRLLEPKLAILDEMDSGLDAEGVAMLVREVHAFTGRGGSVLLITHRTEVASQFQHAAVFHIEGGVIKP